MSVEMHRCKNHAAWLKNRKKYLGGSDVSCILGLNPYKTNVQLYREKKGIVEPDDLSDNPLVQYGTNAEEHIRALFTLKLSISRITLGEIPIIRLRLLHLTVGVQTRTEGREYSKSRLPRLPQVNRLIIGKNRYQITTSVRCFSISVLRVGNMSI